MFGSHRWSSGMAKPMVWCPGSLSLTRSDSLKETTPSGPGRSAIIADGGTSVVSKAVVTVIVCPLVTEPLINIITATPRLIRTELQKECDFLGVRRFKSRDMVDVDIYLPSFSLLDRRCAGEKASHRCVHSACLLMGSLREPQRCHFHANFSEFQARKSNKF
jgi:hypothetical protein